MIRGELVTPIQDPIDAALARGIAAMNRRAAAVDDPTTETPDSPEGVDTPPQWPGPLVTIPAPTDVPQDAAAGAVRLASAMLADVLAYREQIRPCVEAGVIPDGAFDDVVGLRRGVAIVADLLARRDAPGAALVAAEATRWAERIAGLVVVAAGASPAAAAQALGKVGDRCLTMAAPDDDEFAAALRLCADAGSVSADAVTSALAAGGLDVAERQQRETLARLAEQGETATGIGFALGIPAARVVEIAQAAGVTLRAEAVAARPAGDVVPDLIDALRRVSARFGVPVDLAFDEVDRAVALDWSRELWALLVPLVGVRVATENHGRSK